MAVLTGWIGTAGHEQEPVGETDRSGKAQNQELRDATSLLPLLCLSRAHDLGKSSSLSETQYLLKWG